MSAVQRLTDRKRETIIQAAIAEFRDYGFKAASMDSIAARAQVSKRTVYNHFASKDELFSGIMIQLWDSIQDQLELEYRQDRSLKEQLRELMWTKMRVFNDSNFMDLARVAIAEMIHSPERAQAMVEKISEREEGLVAWIRAAQEDGKLKSVDPAFASCQLQGLVKSFSFWPQIAMGQPSMTEPMLQEVVYSAVDMFLAQYAIA